MSAVARDTGNCGIWRFCLLFARERPQSILGYWLLAGTIGSGSHTACRSEGFIEARMTFAARVLFLIVCLAVPSGAFAQPKPAAALPVEIAPSVATFRGGNLSIFSHDGTEIVTADESTVSLWDAESGRLVRTFVGHADDVRSISASGDGSKIVSAGDDKKIIIWDSAIGRRLHTLIHSAEYDPIGVAISRDGRKVLSAINRELKLWDSDSGKIVKTIPSGPYDPLFSVIPYISAIAMSPDGVLAAIAGDTYDRAGQVFLIDFSAANPSWRKLEGGVTTIRSMMFSETGMLVASEANVVKVWNVSTGQLIRSFATDSEKTFSPVAISANGKVVAAAHSNEHVRVWSADTGELLSTVEDSGKAVSLLPDGSRVLVGLQLFSASLGTKLRESPKDPRQDSIAFSSDGALLLSGYHRVWDARSGGLLANHGDGYGYLQAASTASNTIAVSGSDGTVHTRNASTGAELQTFRLANPSSPEPPYVEYARFSRDGKQLVVASSANNATLFDAATGNILQTFSGHTDSVKYADISSDGKRLLTGSNDGSFRLWNTVTGRVIRSIKKDGFLWAGALSPDGSKAAVAVGQDIEIWDVAAGRMTQRLRGHSRPVIAVFYSPDGRIVYSASWDGTIKQWAAATGSLMRTVLDAGGQISSAQLSPDGKRMVSVTPGSGYRIWNADTGALLARIIDRSDGEWLVITPEGFFTASESGAGMLSAVRGRELISIEQVYQSLYRPDLVREKLAGDPRGLVREAAARLDLTRVISSGSAPSVQIVSPAGGASTTTQVAAEVDIVNRGGGVGRVEWRVNGVTVGIETPPAPATNQPARMTRALALDPGSNTIEVVAYNAANLVASIPVRATVSVPSAALAPGQPVAAQPSRLFVIAAGIDDYTDSRFKLAGSVRDARTLSQAFSTSGAGLYQSVNVKLLTDADVSKDKLDAAFREFAAQATPADVFVLHLAGHGKTVDGRYYFVPRDFKVGNNSDEKAVNAAVVAQGIAQEQWQRWFASIPARKSMILFDTCESGSLTGDAAQTKALEQSAANDRLAQATGRSIITASSSTQLAFEYRGHGLFTYNLLDAMERADSDGNGTIEINELAAYVYAQVTRLSEQVFKKRQEPQIKIALSYPLTRQGRVLAGDLPTVAEDNVPSFQLAQTANLQIKPGPGATVVRSLNAQTAVTVLKSEGGWSLVASGGKPLGYVATRDLAPAAKAAAR